MWVLVRRKDGKYVAKAGRRNSYTTVLEHAEKFSDKETAVLNSCRDSEFPVQVNVVK